jgi:hypothetical protein
MSWSVLSAEISCCLKVQTFYDGFLNKYHLQKSSEFHRPTPGNDRYYRGISILNEGRLTLVHTQEISLLLHAANIYLHLTSFWLCPCASMS